MSKVKANLCIKPCCSGPQDRSQNSGRSRRPRMLCYRSAVPGYRSAFWAMLCYRSAERWITDRLCSVTDRGGRARRSQGPREGQESPGEARRGHERPREARRGQERQAPDGGEGPYGSQKMSKVIANLCIKPCCSEQGVRSQNFWRSRRPQMLCYRSAVLCYRSASWAVLCYRSAERCAAWLTDRSCSVTDRPLGHPQCAPR